MRVYTTHANTLQLVCALLLLVFHASELEKRGSRLVAAPLFNGTKIKFVEH
jgi:hypothetical protein